MKTLGSKLAPDIDIMWTGDKVIPKDITVSSLEDITSVLRRPPVIWDNEHANDYDQKRVYLGKQNFLFKCFVYLYGQFYAISFYKKIRSPQN